MENERRTPEEIGGTAREFLDIITKAALERNIPAFAVVGLFGMFTRSVMDMMVEHHGMDRDTVTIELITSFMDGVGVQTVFQKLQTAAGVH